MTEEEYEAFIKGRSGSTDKSLKKPSKYHNRKVDYRDPKTGETITFDSEKERDYYLLLKDRERKGEISCIERQVEIIIQPAFTDRHGRKFRAIKYLADFTYYDVFGDGYERLLKKKHYVDVKGYRTEVYKLKKKLLAYRGIIIEEV